MRTFQLTLHSIFSTGLLAALTVSCLVLQGMPSAREPLNNYVRSAFQSEKP